MTWQFGGILNGVVYRDAHAEWRKGGAIVCVQPRSTLRGMFCYFILFCKLLFSWIEFDDFFFNFQDTYNSRLRERYGDDPSTHSDFDLDLWIGVESFSGLDKNQVYGLSNTTAKNLRATRSVSTVGSS